MKHLKKQLQKFASAAACLGFNGVSPLGNDDFEYLLSKHFPEVLDNQKFSSAASIAADVICRMEIGDNLGTDEELQSAKEFLDLLYAFANKTNLKPLTFWIALKTSSLNSYINARNLSSKE